ncbi:survival protein sure-like phosphatase/nucleotidase [Cunninghamella echinulata]|nr:survival protein sure-like phosphatase/nucleotidase [Cunninghamella echinulata]
MNKYKVLICNDDGPPNQEESPFVLPFIEHLEKLGWDVKVCLPDSQKSWISKAFMIKDKIEVSYYHRDSHEISYHKKNESDFILLSGTPATCVNIALHHIFKDENFDMVICGPNLGRNITSIYTLASGTIGGAIEGTLCGKKSIALSFPFYTRDFSSSKIQNACTMATDVIEQLYKKNNWPKNGLFNINVPLVDESCPIHITQFHTTHYGSLFRPTKSTDNNSNSQLPVEQQVRLESEGGNDVERTTFKFAPDFKSLSRPVDTLTGSDAYAIDNKCISVTPMIASFEVADLNVDYGINIVNKL